MRIFLLSSLLLAFLSEGSALASAGDVGIRVYDHGDLVRVVLEWPDEPLPPVHIRPLDTTGVIDITFDSGGKIEAFHPVKEIPEIADVRMVDAGETHLKIWITPAAPGYQRFMTIGNRVLLDFSKNKSMRDAQKRTEQSAKEDEKIKENLSTQKENIVQSLQPVAAENKERAVQKAILPEKNNQNWGQDPAHPGVIKLTNISSFGFAAFIQDGHIWLVVDQPDYTVVPSVENLDVSFRKQITSESTIFYAPVPASLPPIRVEGGDVSWRVVVGGKDVASTAISPVKNMTPKQETIFWPVEDVTKLIPFKNPLTGVVETVVTVKKAGVFSGPARRFAQFFTPQAMAGLVVVPFIDGLKIETKDTGVMISHSGGVSLNKIPEKAAEKKIEILGAPPTAEQSAHQTQTELPSPPPVSKDIIDATVASGPLLFRFDRWAMGGSSALQDNARVLIADMADRKQGERAGAFMALAKLYLSNGRGAESLGFLRLAAEERPDLANTPEYIGVRGAAYALNNQFDLAFDDLNGPLLDSYPDVAAWRAYILANVQDWTQAAQKQPSKLTLIDQYPKVIRMPMMLALAETSLRAGKIKDAEKILSHIDSFSDDKDGRVQDQDKPPQYDYLRAEFLRQQGKKDQAKEIWEELKESPDDRYRVRARLALAVSEYEEGTIKTDQAIDELESLRYIWRGDEVETTVNSRLGELYLSHGDYVRGLTVLKDASTLAPDSEMGRRILSVMSESFKSVFTGPEAKKIDPIDAITVYEKFSELVPLGGEGNKLTFALVDRLVDVDLLDRAVTVLSSMLDTRLSGEEKVQAAVRMAALQLMNDQASLALATLARVDGMLSGVTSADVLNKIRHESTILRARALSKSGQTDQALALLSEIPADLDSLRSRADIAWRAARWLDATSALEALIALSPSKNKHPLDVAEAENIRNLAIATNLSGDRVALASVRNRFGDLMLQTKFSNEFDVVTRERQIATLADRETLNKRVLETDIFGGFLDTYRKSGQNPATSEQSVLQSSGHENEKNTIQAD